MEHPIVFFLCFGLIIYCLSSNAPAASVISETSPSAGGVFCLSSLSKRVWTDLSSELVLKSWVWTAIVWLGWGRLKLFEICERE